MKIGESYIYPGKITEKTVNLDKCIVTIRSEPNSLGFVRCILNMRDEYADRSNSFIKNFEYNCPVSRLAGWVIYNNILYPDE